MKKLLSFLLMFVLCLALVGCGDDKESGHKHTACPVCGKCTADNCPGTAADKCTDAAKVEATDEEVYASALGEYEELMAAAKAEKDADKRLVLYAKAEAYLLNQAVMLPTTTQGGRYQISRVAPRTAPYVQWGADNEKLGGLVVTTDLIKKADRDDLLAAWEEAVADSEKTYDAKALLEAKGYTIATNYVTTFSADIVTLDILATSSSADTEHLVNFITGLLEYDALGHQQLALAESYSVSEDGKTYTFKLREGIHWYDASGNEQAEVTAQDFVDGFHHMLDAAGGLEYLVDGVIVNAGKYLTEEITDFDQVGVKAVDKYTVEYTLVEEIPYFTTMFGYNIFMPMNGDFYESQGGVFGVAEFRNKDDDTYNYGKVNSPSTILYNGAFRLAGNTSQSSIDYVKDTNYYKADEVVLERVQYVYNDGSDTAGFYASVKAGTYAAMAFSAATLQYIQNDDDLSFEEYAYVADTDSTTYFAGLNLYRRTYALENGAVASSQEDCQKQATYDAMQNVNFRRALLAAFDRGAYNSVAAGEQLKYNNMRNMYTSPEFSVLSKDVDSYHQGSTYGAIVQAELEALGSHVKVADGQDGWYNPTKAAEYLATAKTELGDKWVGPVVIDVFYYGASAAQTAQASSFKASVEASLGTANVVVNMISCSTTDDYYNSGYRTNYGNQANYDVFWGSGWGPDYGDVSTYLDTFLPDYAGYMTKVIGLF